MYITGGVGSYAEGESVGTAYDLPNERAYAESCAAIANLMWNWRMLAAKADRPLCRRHGRGALQRNQFRHVAFRDTLLLSQSA